MPKTKGFLEAKATTGTESGFKGTLTNLQGAREVTFDNEVITNPDGSAASLTGLNTYACLDYDLVPGQKAQNIVLLTSSEFEETLGGSLGNEIRKITLQMSDDIKGTVAKFERK